MSKNVTLIPVFLGSLLSLSSYAMSLGFTNTRNDDVLIDGYDFPFSTTLLVKSPDACFYLNPDDIGSVILFPDGDVVLKKHSYAEFDVNPKCFDSLDHEQRLFSINYYDPGNQDPSQLRALAFLGYTPKNQLNEQLSYKFVNKSAWIMPTRSLYGGDFIIVNINDSGK